MDDTKVLLVGLGGTGNKVVRKVKELVKDTDRQVEFICLDTDINDLRELKGIHAVQTSTNEVIGSYLERVPHWKEWFPNEALLMNKSLLEGAGQIRTSSRLALRSAQDRKILGELQQAVNQLLKIGGGKTANIKVMVVSSMAGGTGSGILLQVPEILKNSLKTIPGVNYMIRGLFVMPDVFVDHLASPVEKQNVYTNAYAVFKELNAMNNICTTPREIPLNYDMELEGFNKRKAQGNAEFIPYNLIFMVDKMNTSGQILTTVEDAIDQAANIVKMQLFSPVSPTLFSKEDNRFISLVNSNGKNIFGSAASAKLIYPYKDIVEYCTYRKVSDAITMEWTYFEDLFKDVHDKWLVDHKKDTSLKEPIIRDTIISSTENELKSKKDSAMAFFKGDLLIGRDQINVVEDYYNKIKNMVEDLMVKDEEVVRVRDLCNIGEQQTSALKNKETALNQIVAIEKSLDDYKKEVDRVASHAVPFNAINSILSLDLNKVSGTGDFDQVKTNSKKYMKGEYELYNLFTKDDHPIHPLSARYVISKLIDLIEKESKTVKENLIKTGNRIEKYEEAFDDPETEGVVETPVMIYQKYAEKIIPAFLNKGYKEFVETYTSTAQTQQNDITKYSRLLMYTTVFDQLLERLKNLEDTYNRMFSSLNNVKDELDSEAEKLENKNNTETFEEYVFATPEDKEEIYESLEQVGSSEEYNETVYNKLNESLYIKSAQELNNARKQIAINRNKDTQQTGTKLSDLFTEIVIPASRDDLIKNCDVYLNRNVVDALFSSVGNTDEVKDKLNSIYYRATPLVTYNGTSKYDEGVGELPDSIYTLNYWGMNPAAMQDFQDKVNPMSTTVGEFLQTGEMTMIPEISESEYYSPYELVCYNSVYGIEPTQLTNIDRYSDAYNNRIKLLKKSGIPHGITEATYNTITPHLDIRWHTTLPEISAQKQREELVNNARSLLLALIYDNVLLFRKEDDNKYYHQKEIGRVMNMLEFDGKNLKQEDVSKLYQKANNDFGFVRDQLDEFNEMLQEDLKNIDVYDSLEDSLNSNFVKGLIGESPNGQNILEIIDNFQKSDRSREKGESSFFSEQVDNLIREFSEEADSINADEINKAIRQKIFETSKFASLPVDSIEYYNYSNWVNNE